MYVHAAGSVDDFKPAVNVEAEMFVVLEILQKRLDIAGREDDRISVGLYLVIAQIEESGEIVEVELLESYCIQDIVLYLVSVQFAFQQFVPGF